VRSDREGRAQFLDLGFDTLGPAVVAEAILQMCRSEKFAYVVTPNVDHIVKLHRRPPDDELWAAYCQADLCLCDSRILQVLAHRSGVELPLVTGSDLTLGLLLTFGLLEQGADGTQLSVTIIGGDAALERSLVDRYPRFHWFHHIPPMGVLADPAAQDDIINFVERVKADIVFFAIGAPQSELLCHRIARAGNARGVALCTGASLEFVTGAKRRAPVFLQRLKLEWLFRLLSEPTRLWRRYLVEGPAIFRIWYRWHRRQPPRRYGEYDSTVPAERR
jgi:N-acetylglucosaminyldiphosphoundecaprenol N-acetyl-beta-D-mannosaminyltransferase